MRFASFFFILLLSNTISVAQKADSTIIKKITVNGFCLCQTTVSILKQQYPDLKEVDLNEMDVPKECFGQDARYVAGKGYITGKQIGLIFQKDQESDQISKIRLTKQFKGYLPNGKYINMSKLILKELSNLYPELKDKWGSRGCSEYWNFSNDTISFFVKINVNKKPQFPIDEAYYMNKPIEGIDLMISCYSLENQEDDIILPDESKDPVYLLDSVQVNKTIISHLEPVEIAYISVYKDTLKIKKIFKGEAKRGLIYIETKSFARQKYWSYFKSKSSEYARLVPTPLSDTTKIVYILNEKVLKDNYEGYLSNITDKDFRKITIIDQKELIDKYNIHNKEYGILIITKPPVK